MEGKKAINTKEIKNGENIKDKKSNYKTDGIGKKVEEFEQRLVDLARVTRVMAGGKRMKFRACVVVGNHKGQVGFGLAKGLDVSSAINKAFTKAKRQLIDIHLSKHTIPFEVREKFKAAQILIKPAPKGTGIKAGGAVRIILELSGIEDVVAKILGSSNKINNVQATLNALKRLEIKK